MAEADTHPAQDSGELDEALLRAISHPLRHRLLGMLDGRTASPNMLARELGLPLGRVSYHIRLLSDLGAIELVRTEPRRGALEHFYRAVTTVWFSEADWQKLPRSARRGILGQNLQHIFSASPRPLTAAASRESSVVLRAPLELDEEGLSELSGLLRDSIDRARDINTRAAERRAAGDSTTSVPTELAILHYERAARKLRGHGRSSTRARRDRGGARAGRRVDRRARAATDPGRVRHVDHRRRGDRRRLRARARARDPARPRCGRGPFGAAPVRGGRAWAARSRNLGCCSSSARCRRSGAAAALLTAFAVLEAGESRTGRRWWLGAR